MHDKSTIAFLAALTLLCGCARDLKFGDDSRYLPDTGTDTDAEIPDGAMPLPAGGPQISHSYSTNGAYLARVNATDHDAWIYLDLDTGLQVMPEHAEDDDVWDIAFRRSNIASNGGDSGMGGVEVASLRVPFDDVTSAPTDGFEIDMPDGDDEDTLPDYAFRFWYLYDVETHILTPDEITYVVKTTEGAFMKVRVTGYYDHLGTSGNISFRWQPLP